MVKRPNFMKVIIFFTMFLLVFQLGAGFAPVHAESAVKTLSESKGEFTDLGEVNTASSSSYTVTTDNTYWASGIINGDLYIGPNSVVTINGNVTVTGDVYVYGALVSYGGLSVYGSLNAKNVNYSIGSTSPLYQGSVHYRGGSNSISSTRVSNQAYEVPFIIYNENLTNENGTVVIEGKTLPFLDVTIQGKYVSLEADGTFAVTVEDLSSRNIEINLRDVFGNNTRKNIAVKDVLPPAEVSGFAVSKKSHDAIQMTWNASADNDLQQYALYLNGEIVEYVAANITSYTFANLNEGAAYEMAIAAVDSSDNESEISKLTATTLLSKPSVNPISPNSTSITGQAYPGTAISVQKGETVLGSGSTDSKGKFNITISPQDAGTVLSVIASNSVGVVSDKTIITVEDKTAPAKPTLDSVSDKDVTITGTAEVSSKLTAKVGDQVIGKGVSGEDEKFSITIPKQKAGLKITVTATDESGNISEANVTTVLDVTPPATPKVNKVTDTATAVTGAAEAGAKVTVKIGTAIVTSATAAADGKFSIAIAKQKIGTRIFITATDQAGNSSEVKEIIVVDGTAPEISLKSRVTNYSTRIVGTAEVAAEIIVKSGETILGTAMADEKGEYLVTIEKQKIGTKLSIAATDAAGNSSKAIPVTVIDGSYPDLREGHWAFYSVTYLTDYQVITGYPNGTFQPNKDTTRAEAAKMLALALDLPIKDVSSGYKDVSSKHWAKDYIAAVTKAGLFNGNPDGTFAPNDSLKRSEMAKIISIAFKIKESDTNYFTDVKKGHWARGYISGLYENSIATGVSSNKFLPNGSTTRAQFSVFLTRALSTDSQ